MRSLAAFVAQLELRAVWLASLIARELDEAQRPLRPERSRFARAA
jgi:hypothetical protein